jgi:hypothetical protein
MAAVVEPPHPLWTPGLFAGLFLPFLPWSPSAKDKAGLKRLDWFRKKGFGYYKQQTTYPQTLGYGLADSPVGLLAWIYEKLVTWTDDYKWEDDEGTHSRTLLSLQLN